MSPPGVVRAAVVAIVLQGSAAGVQAQTQERPPCRFLCDPEWKAEPTFTIEHVVNRSRVEMAGGTATRLDREGVFETVLALELATRLPRLGFTAEAIFAPFSDDNEAELEFETDLHWLTEGMSRGWVSSHFDIVDQFSPAARPDSRHAYTHKLDFELDTAFHVFKRLPETRWLHGVELETSLDYLATGIPKKGDTFPDGVQYLDDASHWSFSFVIVLPVAPF
jgi:hypothetical protein